MDGLPFSSVPVFRPELGLPLLSAVSGAWIRRCVMAAQVLVMGGGETRGARMENG
jgi:hypothetical protein